MNNLPAILENDPGIILVKEVPMVGSRLVAEKFGKSHKNVLRGIQNLDCSAEFNGLNFELINYTDSRDFNSHTCTGSDVNTFNS